MQTLHAATTSQFAGGAGAHFGIEADSPSAHIRDIDYFGTANFTDKSGSEAGETSLTDARERLKLNVCKLVAAIKNANKASGRVPTLGDAQKTGSLLKQHEEMVETLEAASILSSKIQFASDFNKCMSSGDPLQVAGFTSLAEDSDNSIKALNEGTQMINALMPTNVHLQVRS